MNTVDYYADEYARNTDCEDGYIAVRDAFIAGREAGIKEVCGDEDEASEDQG
jgi:ABC-type transporter lipoprotein component MlaA